jgi:hypothetical protein
LVGYESTNLGAMTTESIQALQSRLAELELKIAETEDRLPAHSIKPPVMLDLLALEDERDDLLQRLKQMQQDD